MKTIITIENGRVTVQVDDNSPVEVKPSPPPAKKQESKPAKKVDQPERKCEICGGSMAGKHALAKVCGDECRAEKQRRYQAEKYAEQTGQPSGTDEEVQYCKHCKGWTTHDSDNHPKEDPNFADPWNCGTCRTLGKLCELHTKLDNDGHKPPKRFPA